MTDREIDALWFQAMRETKPTHLGHVPISLVRIRFAALVAAAEREACAKVADDMRDVENADPWSVTRAVAFHECADAIRKRGEA